MANNTTPPNPTNLFGATKGDGGGIVATVTNTSTSLFGSGGNNDNSKLVAAAQGGNNSSNAASSWFEEDDELLLSHLLLGEMENNNEQQQQQGTNTTDSKLDRLIDRLDQDLSRLDNNDGWWNRTLLGNASSFGFDCQSSSSSSSFTATTTGASSSTSGGGGKKQELPKSFNTPEGQSHLRALVDLLGITQERAVKITLASLRSFASVGGVGAGGGIGGGASSATASASGTTATTDNPISTPPLGPTNPASSSAAADSDKENDNDNDNEHSSEQEAKLRSLLGTKALFHRVLVRHRRQFAARLRVITESLRLEQESKDDDAAESAAGGGKSVGTSCAQFLDKLDSKLSMNGRNRGLFQLLLRLATGPPLPGIMGGSGGGELPFSVSRLRGVGGSSATVSNAELFGGEESFLAIRNEAAEALLVLLYDRIDGGVQRLDLFLVLEAAANCGEYEFGMTAEHYSRSGGGGGGESSMMMLRGGNHRQNRTGWQTSRSMAANSSYMDDQDSSSPMLIMENMKCRLNGLWALICAECMGLWRANGGGSGGDSGNNWIDQHPFFTGLDLAANNNASPEDEGSARGGKRGGASLLTTLQTGTTTNNNDPNEQAQKELEALRQKLRLLGTNVRERRHLAYSSSRKRHDPSSSVEVDDGDDELWGVQAPEAVSLLTFGLLLKLASAASAAHPSDFLVKLGEWGGECAKMANDDCGAFAYLHRVLEWMVLDPLVGRKRCVGNSSNNGVVRDLLRRGEVEMAAAADDNAELALMDEDGMEGKKEEDDDVNEQLVVSDAASILYASIGREILSATIRAFRDALLSLTQSRSSAVENIGMLADLASLIYRNEKILCEQFWLDWEDFCQGGGGNNDGMNDDGESNDEPMCYLLDASHSLAVSTLEELKIGGSQQAIIHYLKPLATFLHLIASLCASSSMVQSILTSEFLPDGLLSNAMSVVAALAPLVSSLNEAADGGQGVTSEERSTMRYATVVNKSISTLAYLGGGQARDWIRKSLPRDSSGPQMIFNIASHALPRTQNSLESECTSLSSSALNMMVDLLVEADVAFQMKTCACFTSSSFSSSSSFGGGDHNKMSGFAPFVTGGMRGEITLATMSILNHLAINLTRNVFNPTSVSSGAICAHIETIGGGVMAALDVLSTLVSSGEVSFPTSRIQVATAHAILSSIVETLASFKQIIYLHEDDEVRSITLAVRNDIISALSSSTPLGQVVAFLASAPIALNLTNKVSSSKELARVMDSASASYYHENKRDVSSKYGAWGRFVTPKRASQRASKRATAKASAFSDDDIADHAKEDTYSDLYDVVVTALSLLIVWGEHAEDIADIYCLTADDDSGGPVQGQNLLFQNSPCSLLLSRASPSSLQPHYHAGRIDVANLNLISRLVSAEDVLLGGAKSDAALLSAKIIKMCLRHTNIANDMSQQRDARIGLSAFRVALGGGTHMFKVLLAAFDRILDDGSSDVYFEHSEQLVFVASIMLETLAVSVSSQPDLARAILLGGESNEDWKLVDKMVSCVMSTSDLMNASRENESVVDNRVLNLRCLITCACLHVVSELWRSCRLTCKKSPNSDSVHACGIIASYLTNTNKSGGTATAALIANVTVELTRCSLLAIMSLEEKNSMSDVISTTAIHQKCILLDLLTRSLDIITIETVSRAQTKSQGGIKFVEDLFDSGPMECWKVLLSSSDATASAASSWLTGFSSLVGRSNAPNWNIASFLQANQAEEEISTSSWCSFGSAVRLAKAVAPSGSTNASTLSFRQCSALHVLAQGEASFSASWATFFEVATANVIATRSSKEVSSLTGVLVKTALAALSSVSGSRMISQSLLSGQGLLETRDTKPIGELCSLLLYSLTVRTDFINGEDTRSNCQNILEMIGRLYESANKLFVMTQLGSVPSSSQEAVCLIRQRILTSALVLMSEFEGVPKEERSRDEIVKYNDLRIGFADLASNALQSLQYVQLGADDAAVVDDGLAPSKYGYGFGSVSENSSDVSLLGQEAAYQLLRASLSLLSRLAPTTIGPSSKQSDYQTYTYGVNFAACLKGRNTFHFLEKHFETASNVASLTYQAVHAGSSTHSVAVIHNNSVDVVRLITSFFHALTDAGSTIVDILVLLMENRVFQPLIDNPLLKSSAKIWTSSGAAIHRGYYTNLPSHAGNATSSAKSKPSSQKDPVHFIWREVINIFSSLLRSARCQSQTYAKVDEPILRQLIPVTSVVLDFVCTYESDIFSCFSSMLSEARAQSNLSSRGGKAKSSSFSSSIQSSSFAFTPNLLKESADISSLFAEICKGDNKNKFERQCGSIYERVCSTSLELTKIMSSFLGSIGNARELFLALSSASNNLSNPAAMFDAHPLLSEGIPNARHEAIRNAHFAHSCCILATAEDFKNSHNATTKAAQSSGNDKSLEQTFQIQVNNKYIFEVEQVAGHCLFNALAIISDSHPASNSFISFTSEEASRLDVAAVITPGTTVAICSKTQNYIQRYCTQPQVGEVRYGRSSGCDRSTRTISVGYSDSGAVERHVPWSRIVGIEDTSKRQCIFSYLPTPKSIAEEAVTSGSPSLGHLILALKWCRHVGLASLDPNASHCPMHIVKCVAERVAVLLCTEVLLHDELRERSSQDDTDRKVNMQLLDLFEHSDTGSAGLMPRATVSHQGDKALALVMGEDILGIVQKNLKHQLQTASLEREEEQKIWEQNNSGWDNTSFWGSKRQGRRSPFRLMRKTSSDLS